MNNSGKYIKLVIFLTIIILSLIFFFWEGMSTYLNLFSSPGEISVPNIVGKNSNNARSILKKLNLELLIVEGRFSNDIPENVILEQNPAPGRTVKKGRDITVIVSSGPDLIEVPNLIGKELREAKIMLANFKLSVGNLRNEPNSKVEPEHVFKQTPEAGQRVKKMSKIDLYINSGAEPDITIPNWVGKNISEAKTSINKLKLTISEIKWVSNDESSQGSILKQSFEPGEKVYANTMVSLTVSLGPASELKEFKQELFNYTMPLGSSNQSVKIVLSDNTGSSVIYQGNNSSGDEIQVLATGFGNSEIIVYLNDQIDKRYKF